MEKYTVDGHKDLARDPDNNSIEEEVANIKSDITEIKSLLKELINGS